MRIDLDATGVLLRRRALTREDASDPASAEALTFAVPYTPMGEASVQLRAHADYFVCTDTTCLHETRDLALTTLAP